MSQGREDIRKSQRPTVMAGIRCVRNIRTIAGSKESPLRRSHSLRNARRTSQRRNSNGAFPKNVCTFGPSLLEHDLMERPREEGSEASESDRKGLPGREVQQGESPAIPPDPLAGRKVSRGSACHHEPRKVHAGSRPSHLEDSDTKEGRPEHVETQRVSLFAASPGVHSQEKRQAPAAGHPHHERPGDASGLHDGSPAHCGGDSGPQLVWVSPLQIDCGCHGCLLYMALTLRLTLVGARRRHHRMFRQH